METHGIGHGKNVVETFLQDTHFGHPYSRPYTPIGGFPLIGGTANMYLGVEKPPYGVEWGVGPSSSDVFSCGAVSDVLPITRQNSCMTPILATHPQDPIRPLMGPHASRGTANMRLEVGQPPYGVWWGCGTNSSDVSSCGAISRGNK